MVPVVVTVVSVHASARRGGRDSEVMAIRARSSAISLTRCAVRCCGVRDAVGFPGWGATEVHRKSRHPLGVLLGRFRRRGEAEATSSERVGCEERLGVDIQAVPFQRIALRHRVLPVPSPGCENPNLPVRQQQSRIRNRTPLPPCYTGSGERLRVALRLSVHPTNSSKPPGSMTPANTSPPKAST